jgi:hypothetical protein
MQNELSYSRCFEMLAKIPTLHSLGTTVPLNGGITKLRTPDRALTAEEYSFGAGEALIHSSSWDKLLTISGVRVAAYRPTEPRMLNSRLLT